MAKKILGAVISPLTTLMGINPLFPKKKAAATTTVAAPVAPVKKPAFAPDHHPARRLDSDPCPAPAVGQRLHHP
jgi:hypothetical protein